MEKWKVRIWIWLKHNMAKPVSFQGQSKAPWWGGKGGWWKPHFLGGILKEKLKKSGVKWANFCVKSAGGTQVGGILRFLKKKWAVIDIFMSFLCFVAWKHQFTSDSCSFTYFSSWNVPKRLHAQQITSTLYESYTIFQVGKFWFFHRKWETKWAKSGVGSRWVGEK